MDSDNLPDGVAGIEADRDSDLIDPSSGNFAEVRTAARHEAYRFPALIPTSVDLLKLLTINLSLRMVYATPRGEERPEFPRQSAHSTPPIVHPTFYTR